jgi:hypothetical protein
MSWKRITQTVWLEDGTDDELVRTAPDGRLEIVPATVTHPKAVALAEALLNATGAQPYRENRSDESDDPRRRDD